MKSLQTQKPPVCLACALLFDGPRVLFLKQTDREGRERIGLPCVLIQSGENPVQKLTEAFVSQTGIDGFVQQVVLQGKYNVGSRKRKNWIPAQGFAVSAKSKQAKPSNEFSGFCWLTLDEARTKRLNRETEWLLYDRK